jgi:hypothetical protein
LAATTAARRLPAPESVVFETVKTVARTGATAQSNTVAADAHIHPGVTRFMVLTALPSHHTHRIE